MTLGPRSAAPQPAPPEEPATLTGGKLPWSLPELTLHGDLRGLTMGPTPGTGESGPGGNVWRTP